MRSLYSGASMALATLLLSGCIREARIAIPSQLAIASQRLELTDMGAGERGQFQLGSSKGHFTRSAIHTASEDGFLVQNSGGGTFVVAGPDVEGELSARCDFGEVEIHSGVVVATAQRFAYRCRFQRDGQPIEAGLILEEIPRSPGKLLSGRTRAGKLHFADHVIGIRAIHDMEGGRMPTGTPLGYMFDIEGRQIGAVDLNGLNKTIHAPNSGPEREAVIAASVALSILWDPGE
ncbi:hypothetical protein [Sphingomonas cavernae]|nr:hypothetical protein [Sphingomonas cavernae]